MNTFAGARPQVGTWLKLDTPETVELAAAAGLDFVIVDLEHAIISDATLSAMLGLGRGLGIDVLVRVPDHRSHIGALALDQGAAGLVAPDVRSAEHAREVVAAVRFAPQGERGLSASGRAGGWGHVAPLDFASAQNAGVRVWAQVESPAGVAAAVDIASVPGIDGLLVGPVDLASTVSAGGVTPSAQDLLAQLEQTCATHRIPLGTAGGADRHQAQDLVSRGYQLLALSSDSTLLRLAAAELRAVVGLPDRSRRLGS